MTRLLASTLVLVAVFAGTASAVHIPTVTVGDPGNGGELSGEGAGGIGPDRICGSVGYTYNIGKYEVTAGQYAEFLSKVAATDPYGLYNTSMAGTQYGCGISRSGTSGSYVYSVAPEFVSRPVNNVSFWGACRFANWLHNGQPTGDQVAGTTETGAYTLTPEAIANNTVVRNPGAQWAVTSEDEWYKAAYYKGGSANAGYWDYPTSSDDIPGRDLNDFSGNNANYFPKPIDPPYYTTVVGRFQNSASPYGTFDQAGNVWEWNESVLWGTSRDLRGGSFETYISPMQAATRSLAIYSYPIAEIHDIGFRVVQVPEPATLASLGLSVLAFIRRRRWVHHRHD